MANRNRLLSKKHVLRAEKILQEAVSFHQTGNLQKAETLYLSILKKYPNHPHAMYFLGVIAHQVGKDDLAIARYEETLAIKPDYAEAYCSLGNTLQTLGRGEEAIEHYEKALVIKPDFAEAYYSLGYALQVLGRGEEAIDHYEKALAIKPDYVEANINLGNTLLTLGLGEEAIEHYEKALAIKPDFAGAHINLGNVLQSLGRWEEAIDHYEQALAIKPDFAGAYYNLGNVLQSLGRGEEAIDHFEKALAIKPDYVDAHNNLGNALQALGRMKESIVCYEQALAIKPDFAEAHDNLGLAFQQLGRENDAFDRYEQALAIKPDFAKAYHHLSVIDPKLEQVPIIEHLLTSPTINEEDAMFCHFALGNIYNNRKSFTKAFKNYQKANDLKRKTLTYDSHNHSVFVDKLISAYSKSYFQEKIAYGSGSQLPVFIVGMPRSGTTLVEQIISNHSQVHGAGELLAIALIEKTIAKQFDAASPCPECLSLLNDSDISGYYTEYLKEIGRYSQDATRITDKMPDNFLRLGLIKTLFPKAHIIHCKRNALDTCMSIYNNYFMYISGNEYSCDLNEIGQYYLDYERLMKHWDSLFSSEIFEVQYEELVTNQETVSRQLIAYLGLEWDEKCLDFHKNKRAVRTISNLQVRQPIYRNSINRWKQYEEHLDPLIAILQHLI